ncbi:MAG: hypothetical protein FWH59_04245 [Lentimicrobiaceae bacterium]|nr:hypothetical protein [Lentimicrobiaceae bacterium]
MNEITNLPQENKKRAAFKRFSQMSAAGVAVISLSAFANATATQLPAYVEPCSVKEQSLPLQTPTKQLFTNNSKLFGYSETPEPEPPYGDFYSDSSPYINSYSNHTDYSNNYSNTCD